MVEWLVIVYDKPGTDRTKFRSQHLQAIPSTLESSTVTNVGAIFNKVPKEGEIPDFAGSSFNINAESREEIIEFLKQDIYYKEGIWDLENVTIFPYGCAARVEKKLKL